MTDHSPTHSPEPTEDEIRAMTPAQRWRLLQAKKLIAAYEEQGGSS